jgi:hypothetical protein
MGKKRKDVQHQLDLVVVKWRDAFDGPNGWFDPKEYDPDVAEPVTCGWLLPNFLSDYITVVSTYLYEGDAVVYSNPVHIPENWVLSINRIPVPGNINK